MLDRMDSFFRRITPRNVAAEHASGPLSERARPMIAAGSLAPLLHAFEPPREIEE
jgi:hypothetical protein